MMATRPLGLFSRIHFASNTITMLLPLPCVCQMIPPFFRRTSACAALTPKYWCARGNFFTPPSKSTKSCISSISRSLRHILSRYLSSLRRLLSSSSSFHLRKNFSGVPMVPYRKPLGVVAGENELNRAEEPSVELRLLIREVLTDAVADAHAAVLQLQDRNGDAIHIQDDVGAPFLVPLEGHFLGNGEIVPLRLLPVDEVDGFRRLARLGLYGHAVAQQVVDGVVVAVEPTAVVIRFGPESVESRADLRRRVTALGQPCREPAVFDVAVARRGQSSRRHSCSPVGRGTGRSPGSG